MDKNKLLSIIRLRGISITSFVKSLNDKGVHMTKITFYRKINGDSDFRRAEIMAISKILKLSDKDILDIFFATEVA